MAKKPAITGIGRPQGFVDDIIKAIKPAFGRKMTKNIKKAASSVPKARPPQPPKKSGIKPPSMRTDLGKGRPAMTTKELDAYRKMQGFDKTVSDIQKPKKKVR
jgi:hypothetical protein